MTHETEKKVIETSLTPAYPLISNQPDRFGALSEAFLFVEEKRLYDIIAQLRGYGVLATILLSLPIIGWIVWRAMEHDFTGMAVGVIKIIFLYLLIASIVILLAIFIYRKKILEILEQLEQLANFGDDMARFYMPYMRSELQNINTKLKRQQEEPAIPSGVEIVRDLWPLINLLLKRDPNILHWGKVGLKVYKTLSAFFKVEEQTSSKSA